MSFSQNVRFSGVAPADTSDPHPPGRGLARSLEAVVRAAGWEVLNVDDWRDCGWSILCDRGRSALEIALAEIQPSEWMLQIGPTSMPRLVSKLRGWEPSAERSDVYDLATHIHAFLGTEFRGQRWCWDGFPDDSASTPEPTGWQGAV